MAKPLRILIVGPAWPLRGGLATYNERLCAEFNAMGHQAEILSFSLQYPKLLFPGKTQISTDPKPDNITIYSEINSINPFNWVATGNKFAKKNYDIIVFRYWMSFMAPAFGTIARLLKNDNTKILAIADNIVPHERRFFDSLLTRYFIKPCHGFLCMSQDVQQQVKLLEPTKPVAYVPHPMYDMFGSTVSKQEAKQSLNLDERFNYLLFFGFIRKYKGLQLLLESFAQTNYKKLNLKLIIAGEFYEDSAPYLALIEQLGLKEFVLLHTDFIPNNKVSQYFCAADMVVQTYLNATQSGVTQIAYYYNKPMLVTNVGGLAELVPHQKVGYVCNKNTSEIAQSITDFYEFNKLSTFEQNIAIEKQKFTWNTLCNELIDLTKK